MTVSLLAALTLLMTSVPSVNEKVDGGEGVEDSERWYLVVGVDVEERV